MSTPAPAPVAIEDATTAHDLDAEAAVLGAILVGAPIPAGLLASDFYREGHREIFAACRALADAGEPVDAVAARHRLDDAGQLERVGGGVTLSSLMDALPDAANINYYAAIVRDLAVKREAVKVARHIIGGGDIEGALAELQRLVEDRSPRGFGFQPAELTEFLEMELPERARILGGWLHEGDLGELHSKRGGGKTYALLGLAVAVAAGAPFLGWEAGERPAGVLFVDGEMPARTMQDRLAMMVRAIGKPLAPLLIVTPDLQEQGMRSLNDPISQAALEHVLDEHPEARLVILDNLSALCGGAENEAESWQPMQDFLLRLRRRGLAVLFAHHSGKGGLQRGTSRREDILDVVLNLKVPSNYHPSEGARFELHFEKARGIRGDAVQPFEASLVESPDGLPRWATKTLEDSRMEEVARLAREGIPQKEIAAELGINKSNVSRAVKRARAHGLLDGSGGAE